MNYSKRRIVLFSIISVIMFIILTIKLGYVQFYKSNMINKLADELWSRDIPIYGYRGNIYDCNGKLIVGNKLTPSIACIPNQVKNKKQVSEQLGEILECDSKDILNHLMKNVSVELIKPEGKRITKEQAILITDLMIDGIYVVGDSKRYYPYGDLLCHTLGFCGADNQGITGLEYIYNDYLTGGNGYLEIYTDAKGNMIDGLNGIYKQSSNGFDIYLNINIDIQIAVENIIDNAVSKYDPINVTTLVMEPSTSKILAIASYPTFDMENYNDYDIETYNRNLPIFKSFEPGSTFKICTYSMGLEENVFNINDSFNCSGASVIDGTHIKDWKLGGHGHQTFLEVIQNSCNPGFMEIGRRLGVNKFYNYLNDFGFGEKTGVDLLGESNGIIFNKDIIGPVELATSSFGQGNSVTAIQLLNAANCCVNGGNLMTPYILSKVKTSYNDEIYKKEPILKRKVISEETSKIIRYALENVVAKGTGRGAFIDGYRIGGKTGTAQKVGEDGKYMSNNYILSFLGIAPMDDPKISIYFSIDNPKNTIQYGGVVAAPIVGEMMETILPLINVSKRETDVTREYRWGIDFHYYDVKNYIGEDINKISRDSYFNYLIIGDGKKVISQTPINTKLIEGGTIVLYT